MANDARLIQSKLRLPFIRPNLVPRLELQARVEEGIRGPLTLVTAPAGFGKTTLAASCIASCGMPFAWLSLDKNDNQPERFLTYLIASLQALDNHIGSEAAQLMAGIQQPVLEAVLTSLINDIEIINTEIVLVLDDYHLIKSQAVHEQVAFLLEHQPGSFHLVIATRSDPPLPLPRLRVHDQVIELRAADLRFTESEAAQFLNDIMGLRLDARSIAILEKRTEGWIAGLQMAALSMRDREDILGFIEGFSGTNRFILDFLLEEVLASQPPEIQRFLLRTSILERFSAPLCDALLENQENLELGNGDRTTPIGSPSHDQSISVLQYLERENLFLVSLDDERNWHRYHHLFADLLRVRLQQTQPQLISLLHSRASNWLEQNGYFTEAIQHLFAANDVDQAADLIEHYGPVQWTESDPSVIRMADSLPSEMLISRPIIGLHQAWFLIIKGNIVKVLPLLNALAERFAEVDPASGQRWIQTIIGLALAFLGQPVDFPGFDYLPKYEVINEIPAREVILRDAADILYGMTLGRLGELERAVEVSLKQIHRGMPLRQTLTIPTLVPFLARIYLIQGRLHTAASLCHEYLDPIKEKGFRFIFSASHMNIVLGEVLYEWNCLDEAEAQIREGLRANEPWAEILAEGFGLSALTRVLAAQGDYSGAMEFVEKFETKLNRPLSPIEFKEDLHTLRVRVQLACGDLQKASEWVEQIQNNEDFHLHPERYQLTLAHIYLALGEYAKVEEVLPNVITPDMPGNLITRQLERNLILAAALGAQNRLPEAFKLLGSCLALAEPEGYMRIFLDMGDPIRELLSAYVKSNAPAQAQYAKKILKVCSSFREASSPDLVPAGLIEALSERELEVLQLIALGRTNQEIAQQLIVARGTIKAHAASIYRKLEVDNRTEAVARARQLGILA
ncbi:MAG: hypothetical protein JW908_10740 [Anaerolineales bacterium]|nr:hypothetical protein [Anaerolineales bacterium]